MFCFEESISFHPELEKNSLKFLEGKKKKYGSAIYRKHADKNRVKLYLQSTLDLNTDNKLSSLLTVCKSYKGD